MEEKIDKVIEVLCDEIIEDTKDGMFWKGRVNALAALITARTQMKLAGRATATGGICWGDETYSTNRN